MNTCKDCRFAVSADGTDKATAADGFCYRRPPTLIPPNQAAYPPVALQRFWCGELVVSPESITRQATPTRKKGSRK